MDEIDLFSISTPFLSSSGKRPKGRKKSKKAEEKKWVGRMIRQTGSQTGSCWKKRAVQKEFNTDLARSFEKDEIRLRDKFNSQLDNTA